MSRQARAMSHVAYEIKMCCEAAVRRLHATDGVEESAYLEVELLHARSLYEFLVASKSARIDDMVRTAFAPDWTPGPAQAVQRLKERQPVLHKHLAHLTWARVDDPEAPEWTFLEIAADTHAVTAAWARHVTEAEGKRIGDPNTLAALLLSDLEIAAAALASARGGDARSSSAMAER